MANGNDRLSLPVMSDDDSIDLHMSDGSSDFDMEDTHYDGSIQPYMFEPEADPSSDEGNSEGDLEVRALRVGNTEWCRCGHCPAMPTEKESLCCKEMDQVQNKLSEGCITAHSGFDAVCLNEYVLETAYLTFRQYHGPLPEDQNKRNRYIAYRQFVRWCWGLLGRHVRVILPACAVSSIRNTFPAADGQYNGFQFD